jgi:hypothetical protein
MSYSENQLEQVMGGYGAEHEAMVLQLTMKSKWYDMIASGEKKEEYREIKEFWVRRLCKGFNVLNWKPFVYTLEEGEFEPLKFYQVRFARGGHFGNETVKIPTMHVECKGIRIDYGKPEWGAEPGVKYFVITLGEIIK